MHVLFELVLVSGPRTIEPGQSLELDLVLKVYVRTYIFVPLSPGRRRQLDLFATAAAYLEFQSSY